MEGVGQHVHETPVFMRALKPRRSLQCDFRGNKVKAKTGFSTIFFGICAVFADFSPFSPGFASSDLAMRTETMRKLWVPHTRRYHSERRVAESKSLPLALWL